MGENLVTALEITVVGMGLVFGAIVLLWGVMAALVRLTAEPDAAELEAPAATDPAASMAAAQSTAPQSTAPQSTARSAAIPAPRADQHEQRRRAAMAAVAVALARDQAAQPHEFPVPPTPIVSAWQAVTRGRLLQQKDPRQVPRR